MKKFIIILSAVAVIALGVIFRNQLALLIYGKYDIDVVAVYEEESGSLLTDTAEDNLFCNPEESVFLHLRTVNTRSGNVYYYPDIKWKSSDTDVAEVYLPQKGAATGCGGNSLSGDESVVFLKVKKAGSVRITASFRGTKKTLQVEVGYGLRKVVVENPTVFMDIKLGSTLDLQSVGFDVRADSDGYDYKDMTFTVLVKDVSGDYVEDNSFLAPITEEEDGRSFVSAIQAVGVGNGKLRISSTEHPSVYAEYGFQTDFSSRAARSAITSALGIASDVKTIKAERLYSVKEVSWSLPSSDVAAFTGMETLVIDGVTGLDTCNFSQCKDLRSATVTNSVFNEGAGLVFDSPSLTSLNVTQNTVDFLTVKNCKIVSVDVNTLDATGAYLNGLKELNLHNVRLYEGITDGVLGLNSLVGLSRLTVDGVRTGEGEDIVGISAPEGSLDRVEVSRLPAINRVFVNDNDIKIDSLTVCACDGIAAEIGGVAYNSKELILKDMALEVSALSVDAVTERLALCNVSLDGADFSRHNFKELSLNSCDGIDSVILNCAGDNSSPVTLPFGISKLELTDQPLSEVSIVSAPFLERLAVVGSGVSKIFIDTVGCPLDITLDVGRQGGGYSLDFTAVNCGLTGQGFLDDVRGSVTGLNLAGNGLTVFNGEGFDRLERLILANNNVRKTTFVGCKRLKTLDLTGNEVAALDTLKPLISLEELYVGDNPLASLEPLGEIGKIKKLDISRNYNYGNDEFSIGCVGDIIGQLTYLGIGDAGQPDDVYEEILALLRGKNSIESLALYKSDGQQFQTGVDGGFDVNTGADLVSLKKLTKLTVNEINYSPNESSSEIFYDFTDGYKLDYFDGELTISVPFTVDTVYLKGNAGAVYSNISVVVEARSSDLKITLDNFSFTGTSSVAPLYLCDCTGKVTLEVIGAVTVRGGEKPGEYGATGNCAVVARDLYITGIGALTLYGGRGSDANQNANNGAHGGTGGTALSVFGSAVCDVNLTLCGGNGGNGAQGETGDSGKSYYGTSAGQHKDGADGGTGDNGKKGGNGGAAGFALKVDGTFTYYKSVAILSAVGGNGGKGGTGGQGGAGQNGGEGKAAIGSDSNGGDGGDGGKGGNGGTGGNALCYTTSVKVGNYGTLDDGSFCATLSGINEFGSVGEAGDAGSGGSGGDGGSGNGWLGINWGADGDPGGSLGSGNIGSEGSEQYIQA